MVPETTQINHTLFSPNLYMAIELSNAEWMDYFHHTGWLPN